MLDTSTNVEVDKTINRNDSETVWVNQSPQKMQKKKQLMSKYKKQKAAIKSSQPSKKNIKFAEIRKQYMKKYRKRKIASECFQPSTPSLESSNKKKQYIKEYRKRKKASECFQPSPQSLESKNKRKQYMKEYRCCIVRRRHVILLYR